MRQEFAQRVFHGERRIGNRHVFDRRIVLRQAHVVQALNRPSAVEVFELFIDERSRNFPGAIRPEIEEYERIAVLHDRKRFAFFYHQSGQHEFVGDAPLIRSVEQFLGRGSPFALAFRVQTVGFFDTVPAVVAIHRIVSAAEAGHFCVRIAGESLLHFCEVGSGCLRTHIAPVEQGVDEYAGQLCTRGQLQERQNVPGMRVHASVRQKTHQVERRIV